MKYTQKQVKEYIKSRYPLVKDTDTVHLCRKKVMGHIYTLKKHTNLPRIEVLVCKKIAGCHGIAVLNSKVIALPKRTVLDVPDTELFYTVCHEILHAVYGLEHDENTKIFGTYHKTGLTREEILEDFLKIIKEAK